MLDNPEKTARLLAALKAAVPFKVDLVPVRGPVLMPPCIRHRPFVASFSQQNRGQPGTGRFVVKADGHERHLHDELQLAIEAPREDLVISRRQQKSWSLKCWCCADQRFQVLICVGDGMAEETNVCGRRHGRLPQLRSRRRGLLKPRQ
jgi:hypothetical protein